MSRSISGVRLAATAFTAARIALRGTLVARLLVWIVLSLGVIVRKVYLGEQTYATTSSCAVFLLPTTSFDETYDRRLVAPATFLRPGTLRSKPPVLLSRITD